MLSVIIPCYNQGRFLIDCLESLAIQTAPLGEVVVVNDGSTDEDTNALCARLAHYDYPFPLRVLVQENHGLPAARNAGIRHTAGDVVLPLDADDKLLPTAVEDYECFLAEHPDVDICYPDVMFHGSRRWSYVAPRYNRWRHLQHNWFVPCTAIRRRVFDAGHFYCEDMRRGYEDWELWHRTCILGPFTAAPLCKRVFAYRKWGYSMLSATRHDERVAEIRSRAAALGLWSHDTDLRLRTRYAPSHCWLTDDAPAAGADDLVCRPVAGLEAALRENHVSRFYWFGALAAADPGAIRFHLAFLAEAHCSPLYAFFDDDSPSPYLLVLDRLALLEAQHADLYKPEPTVKAVKVRNRGTRHVWPASVEEDPCWRLPPGTALEPLRQLPADAIFPGGHRTDERLAADVYYYFRRDFLTPALPHATAGARVLALALPELSPNPAARQALDLLASGAHRERFDRVYLFTLDPADHPDHVLFEPHADGIYHLGSLGLAADRALDLARKLIETTQAADLLIVDALAPLALVPALRNAKIPIRIAVSFPDRGQEQASPRDRDAVWVLASEYATLVDRVATADDELASRLKDLLYFPRERLRTVAAGASWAGRLLEWLCPSDAPLPDHLQEVFGRQPARAEAA